MINEQMQLAEIKVETDGGPWCMHNMPCPVFRDKHAVLNMNTGIFTLLGTPKRRAGN